MRTFFPPAFVIDNAENIRAERGERALLRQDLADATGVSSHSIRDYENNGVVPKKPNYNRLAAFFGWRLWK